MTVVHHGIAFIVCLLAGLLLQGCALRAPRLSRRLVPENWDEVPLWQVTSNDESTGTVTRTATPEGEALEVNYTLGGNHGYVQLKRIVAEAPSDAVPVTFLIKAAATGDLEVKFVDGDGSVYGAKIGLQDRFRDWVRVTAYRKDMDYLWGGDREYAGLSEFHLAVSGKGAGTVLLADIGFGKEGQPSSFTRDASAARPDGPFYVPISGPQLDPDRELPGIGFRQRRAAALIPEDARVLEWLKTLQDVSSPAQQLLPTTEDNECHTFNNALVAMAFMLKGERERAERILDFFAAATDRDNTSPTRQNFFLNGEARGFFQAVTLNPEKGIPAYHLARPGAYGADRWMGDMAWLFFAYKYYEQQYGGARYAEVMKLIRDLLVSWYTDDPEVPGGGFVQSGWRKGDTGLHEAGGHPEGNIDAYAFFKLLGEEGYADRVRTWLEHRLRSDSMPLDLYTWRVLAYDGDRAELLDIPDYDLRYRKTVSVNGQHAMGPFASSDGSVTNIWLDGLGHIACAYQAAGNKPRGWFYANQFDPFLMESALGGANTLTLPYTANEQGGFDFDQSKGYISVAAWYIFAKNGFNPMRLTRSR